MAPHSDSEAVAVAAASVRANSVTPYMRVHLYFDAAGLVLAWTEAVLGVVPVRHCVLALPPARLTDLRVVPRFFPSRLGVALALAAASLLVPFALGSLVAVLALVFVFLSFVAAIRVETNTTVRTIPVCWLQRQRIQAFIDTVAAERTGVRHERH